MFKQKSGGNLSAKRKGGNPILLCGYFACLAVVFVLAAICLKNLPKVYSQLSWENVTDNTKISITAGNRAFSSDVRIVSERITDQNVLKTAAKAAGLSSKEVIAFNISFVDQNNNEKQPNTRVRVTLTPEDYKLDAERYALVHIDDYGNAKYLGNIAPDSNREISFFADKFSIYAIIPTRETDQHRYARYTYNFYVDNELVATQTVRDQDILNAPAAPRRERLIFMGWYTENDKVFNGLNLPVNIPYETTADRTINLHARFADKIYSVIFYNPQGNVLATKTGTDGDIINTEDVKYEVSIGHFVDAWTTDASILDNYVGCGNTCNIPDEIAVGNVVDSDITISGDNIKLYPVIRSVKWARYHMNDNDADSYTAATYTAANYTFYNRTITRPADPTRNGYNFVGWALDPQGNNMFDFNTPLVADIDLYAIWQARTNTQYRIIFWKEALVNEHYVEGNYEYASHIDSTGTSGDTITVTQAQINSVLNQSSLADYELERVEDGAIIHGDGSTIANVYLKMKVYTVNFTVETTTGTGNNRRYVFNYYNNRNSLTTVNQNTSHATNGHMTAVYTSMSGDTYDLTQGYSFQARMGEIISDRYPGAGEIQLTYDTVNNVKAFCWRALNVSGDTTNRVSKPVTMIDTLISNGEGITLYLVGAVTTTPAEVNYWFEKPDGSGYEKSEEYSFTANATSSSTTFQGRSVPGYTIRSGTPSGYPGNSTTGGVAVTNIYYNRNTYSLHFYNYNTPGDSHSNIRHGADLTLYDYIPDRPNNIPTSYTFQGWYTTPEYIDGTEFDPTTDVMPMSDLMLYAKWENTHYLSLTFNPNGGNEIPSQRVLYGETARAVEDPTRYGYTFVGWRKTDGTFFSFDNVLLDDTELVASWVPFDTIYVDYDPNGGQIFNEDNLSYVDTSTTAILPEPDEYPEGKYFVGWNVNGRIYYPGNVVMILLSDIAEGSNTLTIVAEWGKEVDTTSYTYDPNGGVGERVTIEQEQNLAFTAKDASELGYSKTGYTFTGWNSAADGSGITYRANTQWAADNRADLPNVLYAQWQINCYTITVQHQYVNGTEFDSTETFEKCYNENYETHPSTKDLNYYGSVTSGEASGTITDHDINVVYTYQLRDALITVHHVDTNGATLAPDDAIPVIYSITYDIQPNATLAEHYDYTVYNHTTGDSNPDTATTGTVSGDVEITFTYTKKHYTLTVNHDFTDDSLDYSEIFDDATHYYYLDSYTTQASTRYNDYELSSIDGDASGTINNDTVVTYHYVKKLATVTALHLDANGQELASPVILYNQEWGNAYQTYPSEALTPYYDYTADISETGTISGDVTVTYTYTPKTFTVTVIHRSGPDNIISTDSFPKLYGEEYSTTALNDPAWEFLSVDPSSSGTVDGNITVTYLYKVASYAVTILHVVVGGETTSVTEAVDYGSYPSSVAPLSSLVDAYDYTQESDCTSPITAGCQITFTYTLKTHVVTIYHVIENGETTTEQQTVDHGSTCSALPKPELLTMYDYAITSGDCSSPITADTEVTITYTLKSFTLTVQHQYENGEVYDETETSTLDYGTPYEAHPSTKDNNYEVVSTEGDVSGTITSDTTVTFVYAKRKAVLTVTHKDSNGTTLASTETTNVNWGDPYSTAPVSSLLTAYTYETTGDDPSGTITGDTTVNYVYTLKKYTLTVLHLDTNGAQLASPVTSQINHGGSYEALPSPTLTNLYDYTPDKSTTGTMTADLTITFTYTKKIATVIVHHVNTEGETIARDVTFTVEFGEVYSTTTSDQVPGNYEFATRTDNYTDTALSTPIDVTYTYQLKDPTLSSSIEILDGADTLSNSSLASDYQIKYTANVGDYLGPATIVITNTLPYPIDEATSTFDGGTYDAATNTITWTEATEIATVPQTVSLTKHPHIVFVNVPHTDRVAVNGATAVITLDEDSRTRTATASESLTVAFTGNIKVYYRDIDSGQPVRSGLNSTGLIGEELVVSEIAIQDYELTNPELARAYYYADEPQEIVFLYRSTKTEPVNPKTVDVLQFMLFVGIPAATIVATALILLHRRR